MVVFFVSLAIVLAPPQGGDCRHVGPQDAPAALANDNRAPAGTLQGGVLTLRLVAQLATWYPEGDEGCGVPLYAFVEEGRPAQIPGPLLRVPEGTEVRVTVRNSLPVAVALRGLQEARRATGDSIRAVIIAPDSTQTIAFRATVPGTYFYWGAGPNNPPQFPAAQIFSHLLGGYIVDPANGTGARGDRILIMTRWRGNPGPAGNFVRAQGWELTAFNGLSWPHTERLTLTAGDTARWRVIAANNDGHAMHLHGFYFLVESKGGLLIDTIYAPAQRRLVVTELMAPGQSMMLRWIPERAGNWIFHCHVMRHMSAAQRLDRMPRADSASVAPPAPPDPAHASHAMHEMAGLVIGITVRAHGAPRPAAAARRTLHLYADQRDHVFGEHPGYGFVLREGARPPAPDSVRIPGSPLVLTRGEPAQIVVHNRLGEALAVHWHGIELESYSDGVAGWSGASGQIAPPIAPGDSFVARMTPPRAGTFIYHVHNEAAQELVSGLYGALLVTEPGATPDLERVFVIAEAGPAERRRIGGTGATVLDAPFVNGSTTPAEQELVADRTYRFRIVSISASEFFLVRILRDSVVQQWRALAVDGADLPPDQAGPVRGRPMGPGTTRDFEVTLEAGGNYALEVRLILAGAAVGPATLVRFRVR